jgi:cyanophycin synthetase
MIDFGHNVPALRALVEAIEPLPHPRKSIVYSVAGDRRDADMVLQGQIIAAAFDRVYIFEDCCRRGRAPGEITALLRRGLAVGPRVREFHEHPEAMKAVEASLRELQAGDLLVVQADDVDATIASIRDHFRVDAPAREVDLAEMIEVAVSRDAVTAGSAWGESPGQPHLLDVHQAD